MDLEDIKSFIDVAQRMDLRELVVLKHGVTLRLVRDAGPASAHRPEFVSAAAPLAAPVRADLTAPLSGVLHLSPSPEAAAFVAVVGSKAPPVLVYPPAALMPGAAVVVIPGAPVTGAPGTAPVEAIGVVIPGAEDCSSSVFRDGRERCVGTVFG